MSNYGNPPSEPYGQPGQPAQDPYAQQQNPYGGEPYAQAAHGVPQGVTFAHWGKRVGAYLIDALITIPLMVPYFIAAGMAAGSAEIDPVTGEMTMSNGTSGMAVILMLLTVVLTLAYFVWNYCIKQGKTGYTIGKGVLGIKLVKAETGQPIGAGMSFVRYLAHFLDSIPCYIGYLWPLWDDKRQTFADKVIGTYVIDQPKG